MFEKLNFKDLPLVKKVAAIISGAYLAYVSYFLFRIGLKWGFNPDAAMANFNITTTTIGGMNTLRTLVGSVLLMMAIYLLLFLLNRRRWLLVSVMIDTLLLFFRFWSMVYDGFDQRMFTLTLLEIAVWLALLSFVWIEGIPLFKLSLPE